MPASLNFPQMLRYASAFVLAGVATLYTVLWTVQVWHPKPQPGFSDYVYSPKTRSLKVGTVFPGSGAWQMGLRPGDEIVAINGQPLDTLRPFYSAIVVGPRDTVDLTVKDSALPAGVRQIRVVLLKAEPPGPEFESYKKLEEMMSVPINFYPTAFLAVGVGVLLLRPDDLNAWLLALLFVCFIGYGPLYESAVPAHLRGFAVAYKMTTTWAAMALFYYFFAVFPTPSALGRKVPWLKHALLAATLIAVGPMALLCLAADGSLPLYVHPHWPGLATLTWSLTAQTGLPGPSAGSERPRKSC